MRTRSHITPLRMNSLSPPVHDRNVRARVRQSPPTPPTPIEMPIPEPPQEPSPVPSPAPPQEPSPEPSPALTEESSSVPSPPPDEDMFYESESSENTSSRSSGHTPPPSPSQRRPRLGVVWYPDANEPPFWGNVELVADPVVHPQFLNERIRAVGAAVLEEERVRIEAREQIVEVNNNENDRTPTP